MNSFTMQVSAASLFLARARLVRVAMDFSPEIFNRCVDAAFKRWVVTGFPAG